MTNNLAQRAADELNVEGVGWTAGNPGAAIQTVKRLISRIDELEARNEALTAEQVSALVRRSEPMPEPVPDYIKSKVCEEAAKDDDVRNFVSWNEGTFAHLAARLIWERGDVEPVDPVEQVNITIAGRGDRVVGLPELARLIKGGARITDIAALKCGMELAKEIG